MKVHRRSDRTSASEDCHRPAAHRRQIHREIHRRKNLAILLDTRGDPPSDEAHVPDRDQEAAATTAALATTDPVKILTNRESSEFSD